MRPRPHVIPTREEGVEELQIDLRPSPSQSGDDLTLSGEQLREVLRGRGYLARRSPAMELLARRGR